MLLAQQLSKQTTEHDLQFNLTQHPLHKAYNNHQISRFRTEIMSKSDTESISQYPPSISMQDPDSHSQMNDLDEIPPARTSTVPEAFRPKRSETNSWIWEHGERYMRCDRYGKQSTRWKCRLCEYFQLPDIY
jgi:hypothetical protein